MVAAHFHAAALDRAALPPTPLDGHRRLLQGEIVRTALCQKTSAIPAPWPAASPRQQFTATNADNRAVRRSPNAGRVDSFHALTNILRATSRD